MGHDGDDRPDQEDAPTHFFQSGNKFPAGLQTDDGDE